jgi:glycerophosphoryl diester phosphodiesterase
MRFSPQLRALDWLVRRPIAHRGLHNKNAGIVENTESAFAAAISANYAIECDLQLTADGEAAVFHDESLDRLIDAEGLVLQRTMKQLKALPFRMGKDRIQSLGELLEQAEGKAPLVIEIKSQWNCDTRLVLRAVEILSHYRGEFALMSFDPDIVEAARRQAPQIVRGIVADRTVDPYYNNLALERRFAMRNFSHLARTQPHFISFFFRDLPFAPVNRIRQNGHPVITWTIRSAEEATKALRYCDQITFEGYRP